MSGTNISSAQRAQNFAQATRKNYHMLPSQTVTQEGATVQFNYPKARLLSKTLIKFDFKFNDADLDILGYTEDGLVKDELVFYKLIRRISLSMNNGWEPFTISGRDLALINMCRINSSVINSVNNNLVKIDNVNGEASFVLELENTLNQRDASGLIILQNEATQVTLTVDFATNIHSENGFSCKVTPMITTFTIPNYPEAFPDISVVKLTKSRTESLLNAGEHIVKMDIGTIYRKIALYFTDENGEGCEPVKGNVELIYNTADTPISIDIDTLKFMNISQFGTNLPKGLYIFDFSGYEGFSNYGGSRDFIDTSRLTEFWARFTTTENCKCTIIQENLSRLR
ncbi:MAG: cytoplasmic protein [Ruminococcaceae bacterium]|nr:cytoplasmic protein [Oscillospiraceae bacterium]